MGTISLAASTVNLAPSNVSKAIVATYTDSDTTDTFTIRFAQSGLATPSTFTVNAVTTNSNATLTTTGNFNKVRKGDGVSAGAGIPGGTTVAAITHVEGKDTTTLTMSASATADGARVVTFTPGAPSGDVFFIDGKLQAVRGSSPANDTVRVTAALYSFDGKNQATTNPSINDATKLGELVGQVHLPTLENNIART